MTPYLFNWFAAVLASAALVLWVVFWPRRKSFDKAYDAAERIRYFQNMYEFHRAEHEEWRKRAEFAEVYAAQLEAELDVPKIDRMNSRSWRHRFPDYKRFSLKSDE